jgi:hypothetical protein
MVSNIINFGGDYKNMFELVNNVKLIVTPYTDFKNIESIVKGGVQFLDI